MTLLTPHFRLDEFLVSDKAKALGIANTPTAAHLANLRVAAYGMECVRAELGGVAITITSAYRNPKVNAAVGGSKTSSHPQGWAVDWRAKGWTPFAAACQIRDSKIPFDQLILETSRKIVHISFDPRLRRQCLTQHGDHRSPFLPGIVK